MQAKSSRIGGHGLLLTVHTVFTLPSTSRFHKCAAACFTTVVFFPQVPLLVNLQVVHPHEQFRTEITFVFLLAFVLRFAIFPRSILPELFPAAFKSTRNLFLPSVQREVLVIVLLQSELGATFLADKHIFLMLRFLVTPHRRLRCKNFVALVTWDIIDAFTNLHVIIHRNSTLQLLSTINTNKVLVLVPSKMAFKFCLFFCFEIAVSTFEHLCWDLVLAYLVRRHHVVQKQLVLDERLVAILALTSPDDVSLVTLSVICQLFLRGETSLANVTNEIVNFEMF